MECILSCAFKEYDDREKNKAEQDGNKRRAAAFSSESDHATMMMNNLKTRVKATEKEVKFFQWFVVIRMIKIFHIFNAISISVIFARYITVSWY